MAKIKQNRLILAMDLSLSGSAFAVLQPCTNTVQIKELRFVDNDLPEIKGKTHGEKLANIYFNLDDIIRKYPITDFVREKGFFRFPQATQALYKVVGVVDFTMYCNEIKMNIEEIAPTSVKKLVAGNGKADKLEVEKAVRNYLSKSCREIIFETDNHSDAVAVGIAYCRKKNLIPEFTWDKKLRKERAKRNGKN